MGRIWEVPEALRAKWASIRETEELLKISRCTIERYRKDGRLKARDYHGNKVLISRESIRAMLAPFL